ncbi:hypothetical protein [Polycladomyces subterraneus]|uniref:Uncharacterized protein n=1 Tax=Polycladomyces subterraneus TaxID=1016997 RepID=A0ABT8IR02_9BACL|nr:hypothetical protein [Polycladomyces subterraneus]MDN4595138.1 hypothetical protein [Polycladomyces subterraneus]
MYLDVAATDDWKTLIHDSPVIVVGSYLDVAGRRDTNTSLLYPFQVERVLKGEVKEKHIRIAKHDRMHFEGIRDERGNPVYVKDPLYVKPRPHQQMLLFLREVSPDVYGTRFANGEWTIRPDGSLDLLVSSASSTEKQVTTDEGKRIRVRVVGVGYPQLPQKRLQDLNGIIGR